MDTDGVTKQASMGRAADFSARFMAQGRLHEKIKVHPERMDQGVVAEVKTLLLERSYDHQRQGYFLYREAAETLITGMVKVTDRIVAGKALGALAEVLGGASGDVHRAVAGALGTLPLGIEGPGFATPAVDDIPPVPFTEALRQAGLGKNVSAENVGRSLVFGPLENEKVLVFKLARAGDSPLTLQREAFWLEFIRSRRDAFVRRFDVPRPVKIGRGYLFRLQGVPPSRLSAGQALHPNGYAICFQAQKGYFDYPNEPAEGRRLGGRNFCEVMFRNARILGRMASMGVLHDALIPLFHNRTQRGRREDRGIYQWIRAGRLDRWLSSCAYPNIGVSGVRDFEHLLAADGGNGHMYRILGTHFLSLLLITGSWFRGGDPRLVGTDAAGRPVDARGLFDKALLEKLIAGIFRNYYKGFVGKRFDGAVPLDLDRLSGRMIEEMGVDRHMEELVRVADQQTMSTAQFRSFLVERGVDAEKADAFERGRADIVIHSGPHLGAFNAAISLPELIEGVGTMAALCVAGRFWRERYG